MSFFNPRDMKHFFLTLLFISSFLSFLGRARANDIPTERDSISFSRTLESGLFYEATLSKNVFKQEAFEVPYEVQVPYEVEEEYEVEVPYEEIEYYEEQVPYEEIEYYEEQVPYTETEEYIDYEEYYDYEEVCREVPKTERQCRTQNVCKNIPEKVCETRQVCRIRNGQKECRDKLVCRYEDRQVCNDEEICRDKTTYETECQQESVRKTRPVTRYREVTKYRTETRERVVTRYRTETRERVVTKYRTETRCCETVIKYRTEERCCVTEYRDVYSHQWTLPVRVEFPKEAELFSDESEDFILTISGSEQSPQVEIQQNSGVYRYSIVYEGVQNGQYVIRYNINPHLDESEYGQGSIQDLRIIKKAERYDLSFSDQGYHAHLKISYILQIKEKVSGELVHTTEEFHPNDSNIVWPIDYKFSLEKDYLLDLEVLREGVLLKKRIHFKESAEYLFPRWDENEFNKQSLSQLKAIYNNKKLKVEFLDKGFQDKVKSTYLFEVYLKGSSELLSSKEVSASEIVNENQNAKINLDLEGFKEDQDLTLKLSVLRQSSYFNNDVEFTIVQDLEVHFDQGPYLNKKLVKDLAIIGKGSELSVQFSDLAPFNLSQVKTKYEIKVIKDGFFADKVLVKKEVSRAHLIKNGSDTQYLIHLNKDLGVSSQLLKKYAKSRKKIIFQVTVKRAGKRLNKGQIISFTKSVKKRLP